MARSFSITAGTADVLLDRGRGEVAFTVSNVSNRSVRGRARLVPLGDAQETWLAVNGEAERDFKTNDTQQFRVRLAAPAGAPAGKYSFRLDMVNAADPDEDYAEGPVVGFEVRPSEAPSRPFPVWLLGGAAALLVIGGIVLWWASRPASESEQTKGEDDPKPVEIKPKPVEIKADPSRALPGQRITLSDTIPFTVRKRTWYFGDDSTPQEGERPEHAYAKMGHYNVRLVVLDEQGQEHTYWKERLVTIAPDRPEINDTSKTTTGNDVTMRLYWRPASGGSTYIGEIEKLNSRGEWEPKVKESFVNFRYERNYQLTTQDQGRYHWRVTAVSGPPEYMPSEPSIWTEFTIP